MCVYFSLAVWNFFKQSLTAAHFVVQACISFLFGCIFKKKDIKKIKIDSVLFIQHAVGVH